MLTVPSLADRLGLSVPQARRLLRSVDSVIQHAVSRGRNQQILISTDIVGVLDRAKELWIDNGITLGDLPTVLRSEMNGNREPSDAGNSLPASPSWERYVQHLETELQRKESEIQWLRERVEHLEPLALPRPRRSLLSRILRLST